MEFGKLIPQIFFDILARWIPGLTVTVAWIILLGHSAWSNALNLVLAGHLGNNNALPAVSLSLTVVPFIVGYVIAPFAKGVQRGNEHAWWFLPGRQWVSEDKAAGNGYDQLRLEHPDAGALCAKIRAEFTMYNALAPAAALIAIMGIFAGRYYISIASFLAIPLLAQRGAKTEGTFQKTTRKFCKAAGINLGPADSATQQSPSPR